MGETVRLDAYYTPRLLAEGLVDLVSLSSVKSIADFAAGGGDLLRAAAARWPRARMLATDVDRVAVSQLRRSTSWEVGRCDFFNVCSRRASSLLRNNKRKVTLVLANPPFSYRGGEHKVVRIEGAQIRCSPAMAFILTSAEYLAPGGQILAIIPASSLTSDRDANARAVLHSLGHVEIPMSYGKGAFPNCSPSTAVLRFTRLLGKKPSCRAVSLPSALREKGSVVLQRGQLRMQHLRAGSSTDRPLIHTSHLRNGVLVGTPNRVKTTARSVAGHQILMPRVGRPSISKVVACTLAEAVVLSDCIIAIGVDSKETHHALKSDLDVAWPALEQTYNGTGAPYTTLDRIRQVLESCGYRVVIR